LHLTDQKNDVHPGANSFISDDVDSVLKGSDVIALILQRMTNRAASLNEDEINQVVKLLENLIHNPHPAREDSDHLEEINNLIFISTILELNIQKERDDGRSELTQALKNLLDNIYSQNGASHRSENPDVVNFDPDKASKNINVLFLCPANGEIPPRIALSAEALSSKGIGTNILFNLPIESMGDFNVFYVHNPHVDIKQFENISEYTAPGTSILLDLDADYEQMPVEHPDYEKMGLSTLSKAMAYTKAMLFADQICVPNNNFASQLHNSGYRVKVIPDSWSKENQLWDKPSVKRNTINIGWIGLPCQLDDATPMRRIVTRILHEFPNVQFVVGGGPEVYRMFDSLPESRRLFLPIVNYEDYPYLISQIDVLINPLRNSPYNRTLTDRWLMEAGVRRIPWIASPLPSVIEWGAGGFVSDSVEERYTHLRQLVLDPNLRDSLASKGRKRAEERELEKMADLWIHLIWDIWLEKQKY